MFLHISDPVWVLAGAAAPQHGPGAAAAAPTNTHVIPSAQFSADATIVGWEFYANTTGDIKLLVSVTLDMSVH